MLSTDIQLYQGIESDNVRERNDKFAVNSDKQVAASEALVRTLIEPRAIKSDPAVIAAQEAQAQAAARVAATLAVGSLSKRLTVWLELHAAYASNTECWPQAADLADAMLIRAERAFPELAA